MEEWSARAVAEGLTWVAAVDELREPMVAVSMGVSVLARWNTPDDELNELIGVLQRQTERLSRIVDELEHQRALAAGPPG